MNEQDELVCPACGYALAGLPQAAGQATTCPECGTSWDRNKLNRSVGQARSLHGAICRRFFFPTACVWIGAVFLGLVIAVLISVIPSAGIVAELIYPVWILAYGAMWTFTIGWYCLLPGHADSVVPRPARSEVVIWMTIYGVAMVLIVVACHIGFLFLFG